MGRIKKKYVKKEIEFTNPNYIENILRLNDKIKSKQISYNISKSNNPISISTYIHFYTYNENHKPFRMYDLRISDHFLEEENKNSAIQFIINPNTEITKKRRKILENTIKNTIRRCEVKSSLKLIDRLNKKKENQENGGETNDRN